MSISQEFLLEGTKLGINSSAVNSTPSRVRSRPSSAASFRQKAEASGGSVGSARSGVGGASFRNNTGTERVTVKERDKDNGSDFLSLFESEGRQTITKQTLKSTGPGSMAGRSQISGSGSNLSHSVFIPLSARSNSTSASVNEFLTVIPHTPQNINQSASPKSQHSEISGHSEFPNDAPNSTHTHSSDNTLSVHSDSIQTELSPASEAESIRDAESKCSARVTMNKTGDDLLFVKISHPKNLPRSNSTSKKNTQKTDRSSDSRKAFSSRTVSRSLQDVAQDSNFNNHNNVASVNSGKKMGKNFLENKSSRTDLSDNESIASRSSNKKINSSLKTRRNSDTSTPGSNFLSNKNQFGTPDVFSSNTSGGVVKRSRQSLVQHQPGMLQYSANSASRKPNSSHDQARTKNQNKFNEAAIVIQRWYRAKMSSASKIDDKLDNIARSDLISKNLIEEFLDENVFDASKIRELIQAKHEQLKQISNGVSTGMNRDINASALKKEKARKARQQAIEELHAKRELRNQVQETVGQGRPPNSKSARSNHTSARNNHSTAEAKSSARSAIAERNEADVTKNGHRTADHDSSSLATSQTRQRSAVDELLETLKKLEEEEKFLTPRNEPPWKDDKNFEDTQTVKKQVSPEYGHARNQSENMLQSQYLSREKLESIMSYLDKVESSATSDLEKGDHSSSRRQNSTAGLMAPSGIDSQHLEHASQTANEVTEHILKQRMELEENRKTVQMLKKALGEQKEFSARQAKESEVSLNNKITMQKEKYEVAVKRHLSFIDQLIDDKKLLSEKCEELVKEMKTTDKKYQNKIKVLQENHDIEIRKQKEVQIAAEKMRREKWIEEQSKKIKEMTVRGLEPEIQRLVAQHKAELKKLKMNHEAELRSVDERAGLRYVRLTDELKAQLIGERETACEKEREIARQSYENKLENEKLLLEQERQRLRLEIDEEKQRLNETEIKQRLQRERFERQVELTNSKALETLRAELVEHQRKHEAELQNLQEKLGSENQLLMENYQRKMESGLLQKEKELREEIKKERDRDIEIVIERLEEDNRVNKEECERAAENKIKRIREKYEGELEEVEKSERQTVEKHNRLKAKLVEVEGDFERTKALMKLKEQDIEELKMLLNKRNEERDHISEVIRQEFADRIVATEEENRRLKNEISELKARNRVELERTKTEMDILVKTKNEELEQVHLRVKEAIIKKEEVVSQLRKQYETAAKRADHLEGLLDQQRKQLLGKK